MTPAVKAKHLGAKSLVAVSQFSGYSIDTLRRYHKEKPDRFAALCVASVCAELGMSGHEIRGFARLKKTMGLI